MLLLCIVLISIEFYIHKKHFEFMEQGIQISLNSYFLNDNIFSVFKKAIAVSFNNDILLGSGESWTRFKLNTSQPQVL